MSSKRILPAAAALGLALAVASCDTTTKPKPAPPMDSPAALIDAFATAYRTMDYGKFAALLSNGPGAEYVFYLNQPFPDTGETSWGRAAELRIQHRMFAPDSVPAGDPPVWSDLWLAGIDLRLTPMGSFTERTDLYRSDINPNGLDPQRWRAYEAMYGTYVLFDTKGDLDYRVDGQADFIVIEDLERPADASGKFLLYRWEDLGSGKVAPAPGSRFEATSWSAVKALYS